MDITKRIKRRSLLIGIIITIIFFLLLINTYLIQTINATIYRDQAALNWNSSYVLEPDRGIIYDRNGERLAQNSTAYTVVAITSKKNPAHISDPVAVAQLLAPILDMTEASIIALLTKTAYQVELRPGGWKIDKDKAEEIRNLKIPGIILREEQVRYYPFNSMAAYLIGFVNYDNQPVLGLESYYDKYLRGKAGQLNVLEDLKGYRLPEGEVLYEPAQNGNHLVSTIDNTIQMYVENALDKTQAMYNPKNMIAIVADPNTGEILAQASRPNFNLNQYWDIRDYNDLTINYNFEPGSTFKIFTLAAAVEEGLFIADDTYKSGKINVPGGTINDHNKGVGWGNITYLEGVFRSSNVAFVKLGYEMLGKDRLFDYIEDFGFGQRTGIDLKNESVGIVKAETQRYPLDVATTTFGQGIAVTPMQMIKATSALANGGRLVTPHLAKEIRDASTGDIIKELTPPVGRQVLSEATSREVSSILEQTVNFGQKSGYIEGYNVAGKTGTAQKIGPDGNYSEDAFIVSFIGYAPSYDPKLLVYVIVDEPELDTAYYGSEIAVPIFTEIMQNSLRYLKVPISSGSSSTNREDQLENLVDYTGKYVLASADSLVQSGFKPIIVGEGDQILSQYPKANPAIARGSSVYLITVPLAEYELIDFTGKSLREVLEYCMVLNIDCSFLGSGYVTSQSVPAGELYQGETIVFTLEEIKKVEQEE